MAVVNSILEITGTTAASDATTQTTLNTGRGQKTTVIIRRVQIKHSSGSAASFIPKIGNVAGFSASTVDQKYVGSSTAIAVLHDGTPSQQMCTTDSTGYLYLMPTPNLGADNVFNYAIYLEILTP